MKKILSFHYVIFFVLFFLSTFLMAQDSYYDSLPRFVKPLALYSVRTKQDARLLLDKHTMNQPLLSQSRQDKLTKRYFLFFFAPWRRNALTHQLSTSYATHTLKEYEIAQFRFYENHLGMGENFHNYNQRWISEIKNNANLAVFPNVNRAAIAVDNIYVRLLPTMDPHFGNYNTVGEGYPFDDFQLSLEWAGTPLHVLHVTRNGDWAFVVTPSVHGWVRMQDIAYVDDAFIKTWESKPYVATIIDYFPIKDQAHLFHFTAYLGSIFPVSQTSQQTVQILIPLKDINGNAAIGKSDVDLKYVTYMPYTLTSQHIALLINQLLGMPYGWGGLNFYGDCSSTLKSLFTPFGLWLPRNSKAQANAWRFMSLNKLTTEKRREAIIQYGKPFTTLISVTGHIMLYLGIQHGKIMTFQNVWALASLASTGHEGRSVIGKAVIMPLEMQYGTTGLFPQIMGDQLALTFVGEE